MFYLLVKTASSEKVTATKSNLIRTFWHVLHFVLSVEHLWSNVMLAKIGCTGPVQALLLLTFLSGLSSCVHIQNKVLTKFGVDSKINLRLNFKVNWMCNVDTRWKKIQKTNQHKLSWYKGSNCTAVIQTQGPFRHGKGTTDFWNPVFPMACAVPRFLCAQSSTYLRHRWNQHSKVQVVSKRAFNQHEIHRQCCSQSLTDR